MSISTISPVREDGSMSNSGPRAGGPTPRRSFTPAQKLAHLDAYQRACDDGTGGGAYLRAEGLYSSQITEWRKLRDAGEPVPGFKDREVSAGGAEELGGEDGSEAGHAEQGRFAGIDTGPQFRQNSLQ